MSQVHSGPVVVWCGRADDLGPLLFTRKFSIEARKRYGKGLYGTHRVAVVQRENVIGYSAKLHHNVVHCGEKTRDMFKIKSTVVAFFISSLGMVIQVKITLFRLE